MGRLDSDIGASVAAPQHGFSYDQRRPQADSPTGLLVPSLALLVALAGLFYWTFGRMWERWHNPSGYYSHGPLVAPIALMVGWLILHRRGLPVESTRGSRGLGMTLLTGSILVHLACMFGRVTFVSGFAFIGALIGVVLYLGGRAMLSRLWFPIVFLAFMVPLPDVTVGEINFRLKLIAASLATGVVDGLGVPVFLEGSDIVLSAGRRLTVEDACSGLRSMISLLAFATLFAYVCKLRGYKRALLFASAVPIAVLANVVRIAVLTYAASQYNTDVASPGGWLHDAMGFAVFVVAFCLMFVEEELLDMLPGARSERWLLGAAPSAPGPRGVRSAEAT